MGVNKVDLANGETLIDLQNDTVTPETLAKGKTAHNAQGEPIVGTMVAGEGVSGGDTLTVECVFDLSTMTVLNFSHAYGEIISALQEGKVIFFKSNYGIGYAFGQLVAQLLIDNILMFQLMIQADLGAGKTLYYFNIALFSDNRTVVQPYIINTTALGG